MNALFETAWPAEHLESVDACPVCNSSDRTLLYDNLVDATFQVAPGKWRLDSCCNCACAYLNPRPDRESIALAYSHYYTHKLRPVTRTGSLRGFVLASAYAYLNAKYGLRRQPANLAGNWLCRLFPPFRGHLDAMMRHLPRQPIRGGALLDIGCGNGAFLALAREAGWRVRGLDFDPRAVKVACASGIDVQLGGVEILAVEHSRYDYITLSHVIEHVYEPVDCLRDVLRLLRPGGRVWIETPNINAQGHVRFGPHWRGLEAPRHLLIFSELALRNALADLGYTNIRRLYRGAIAPQFYAESVSICRAEPLGSVSVFKQPKWPMVSDTLLEEFAPGRRECITLVAERRA